METKPGLKAKLTEDVKQAMKSGDTMKRSALRMLLAAINNAEIARRKPLEDADILGVIAKEAKNRQESIEAFQKGNRPDLVAKEQEELTLLQSYLPAQASRDEIVAAAKRIITEVGAQGPGDKGKVMPHIIAEFKGKADGKEINAVVTELLSA